MRPTSFVCFADSNLCQTFQIFSRLLPLEAVAGMAAGIWPRQAPKRARNEFLGQRTGELPMIPLSIRQVLHFQHLAAIIWNKFGRIF